MAQYDAGRDSEQALWEREIRDMLRSSHDIEGVMIVTSDGYPIASVIPYSLDADQVSAISEAIASSFSLASDISQQAKRGNLDQVYIKGDFGFVILMSLDNDRILVCLCRAESKLGLIYLDMRRFPPRAYATDPILPPRPPKPLVGHAKPEYDDD